MDEYGVKVVWIGTILGEATEKEFEVHKDDVARFCLFRLMTNDMKWVDDFIENEKLGVPMHIIKKYADDDLYKELMCSECIG